MPLYEYRCGACGAVFEVIQKFSDEPLTTHARCGGPVERLVSPPALQFKGTGWYVTDYARGNGKGGGKKKDEPAPPAPPGGGNSDTKAEGKPSAPASK